MRLRHERLHGAPAHSAANDLESGSLGNGSQSGRRAELAYLQASDIERGGNFRPAEHHPQAQVDALPAKEALLDAQAQLQAATIGGYPIADGLCHVRLRLRRLLESPK